MTSNRTRVSEYDKFMLRLPPGLREEIADAANSNDHSMNSEIIARIQTGPQTSELRDMFAGQALLSIGTWMPSGNSADLTKPENLKARAEWAFAQADAMIAARKGGAA